LKELFFKFKTSWVPSGFKGGKGPLKPYVGTRREDGKAIRRKDVDSKERLIGKPWSGQEGLATRALASRGRRKS